jgi:hypothetical protein
MPVEEREDFLDCDPEIPGQKFALISFISPEKVLQKKELFFFEEFVKDYDFKWKTKKLEEFLAGQVVEINKKIEENSNELEKKEMQKEAEELRKYRLKIDELISGFQTYVRKNMKEITKSTIKEDYDDFLYRKQTELDDKFYAKNDFKTTVRGMKVRGVYGSQEEAAVRARKLAKLDDKFDIFCAHVGKWTPWDPSVHQIPEQEYAEEQLNELMKAYKQNEDATDEFYRQNKIKRPGKQVFNNNDTKSNEVADSMFGAVGDLAIARKMEQANVTMEVIKDEESDKGDDKKENEFVQN